LESGASVLQHLKTFSLNKIAAPGKILYSRFNYAGRQVFIPDFARVVNNAPGFLFIEKVGKNSTFPDHVLLFCGPYLLFLTLLTKHSRQLLLLTQVTFT